MMPAKTPVKVEITQGGGLCPVQAEGTINGKPFYFRARGSSWRLNIGGEDLILKPEWSYEEDYGDGPFDAGYMSEEEARTFIQKAAEMYATLHATSTD